MALPAQGTVIRISEDGTTFTDIGCVSGFSWEFSERATIDTTCLTDTEKTFKFGLRDSGTVSIDYRFEPDGAGQVLLEESYASDTPYTFQVEYSDSLGVSGTIKEFDGFVTQMSQDGAIDDIVNASASIKITGPITSTDPVGP